MDEHRTIAPEIESLLSAFWGRDRNGTVPSANLSAATEDLFRLMSAIKPYKSDSEVRSIWLTVPRGSIEDYDDYEDARSCGSVDTYEEFEDLWRYKYPSDPMWYELVTCDVRDKDGCPKYRGVNLNRKMVVASELSGGLCDRFDYGYDEAAVRLLPLLAEPLKRSIEMVRDGTYNTYVKTELPYLHRTGAVKRSDYWSVSPGDKADLFEGLPDGTYVRFQELMDLGGNDGEHVGRVERFTANEFFRTCSIGYKACGYDVSTPEYGFKGELDENGELPIAYQYLKFADGRDEGLTCGRYGNEGPGVDPDDPDAWDEWYFDKSCRIGHPWEVCRGGSSTHISLFVESDRRYRDDVGKPGFYLAVSGDGWSRCVEAVKFYVSLHDAGYPVVFYNGEKILKRFKGEDIVGIVPHNVFPV